MTTMFGKLALVVAAAAGISLAALSPAPVAASAIHWSQGLAAAAGDADTLRVRCVRRASNLWSCNDKVRTSSRRRTRAREGCVRSFSNLWSCNDEVLIPSQRNTQARDSYAYHPCDHANQTASDGTRCGNRAADRRPGGR